MKIEFIAHATFKLTLNDGRVIVIDPYLSMSFQGRFNYPKFDDRCDFAVITHEHLDHNYLGDLQGMPVVVRNTWHDAGLSIHSHLVWHDKFGGTKFGGSVLMKVIEADGLRLCHMGDCGEILTDGQIAKLGKLDILLIPVGGFYTIDGLEAAALAKRIDAVTTIPCHYLTPRCSLKLEDESRFLSAFNNIYTIDGEYDAGRLPPGIVKLGSRY